MIMKARLGSMPAQHHVGAKGSSANDSLLLLSSALLLCLTMLSTVRCSLGAKGSCANGGKHRETEQESR
jgi:hypothetical protein